MKGHNTTEGEHQQGAQAEAPAQLLTSPEDAVPVTGMSDLPGQELASVSARPGPTDSDSQQEGDPRGSYGEDCSEGSSKDKQDAAGKNRRSQRQQEQNKQVRPAPFLRTQHTTLPKTSPLMRRSASPAGPAALPCQAQGSL